MSLKRRFYHSLSLLSPVILETLHELLQQEEAEQFRDLCHWLPPECNREFWLIDPVTGEWKLIGE